MLRDRRIWRSTSLRPSKGVVGHAHGVSVWFPLDCAFAVRLTAFRVENYKKIRDTGWISADDLLCFVGKNESGKSAIFRGLSKLNSSDGQGYDGLKEFPRRRYTDEFNKQDWPVASGKFEFDDSEREELSGIATALAAVTTVEVTRGYSGKYFVDFEPATTAAPVTMSDLKEAVARAVTQVGELLAPDGQGELLPAFKEVVTAGLQAYAASLPDVGTATPQQASEPVVIVNNHVAEAWQRDLVNELVTQLRRPADQATLVHQLGRARTWVVEHLPKFIYFDRYDVLESAVHIPTFLNQLATTPTAPRVRTTQALFKHVGLDPAAVAILGQHQPGAGEDAQIQRQIDERQILASSASAAVTAKFSDWWEQRKHRFRYTFDGDYFRIWVSDDLDPSEIEFDQRSQGLQYFFSFYTVFLVESAEAHAGAILLLDEPALQLHGTAQEAVVRFLDKLSVDNQTFYTTHSPFMVDVAHLERARAVYETEDGTTLVSEDVWPRDRDSLFPLQAALGYQVAQGLFLSKRQVIVEGLTDLWLWKALDMAMESAGLEQLRADIVLVPSAGVSKLLPLASMLLGHGIEIAALLDGDEPARREGRKLADKLLAGEDRRCLFIGDFLSNPGGELEDLFPRHTYLEAVRAAYPDVEVDFTTDEDQVAGVVDQLTAMFERKGLEKFQKWRPAAVLRDQILEGPDKVDAEVLRVAAEVTHRLNILLASN